MADQVIYPVSRLLANPRVFYAIAVELDGPDGNTLKEAFYELLEYELSDYEDVEDCEFQATEACFKCEGDGGKCEIILDNGLMSVLEAVDGEIRAAISTDGEFAASSAIYNRLVQAIKESNPEFDGDIALCSPPTPANAYLRSDDGDSFVGKFHLLSDPAKEFHFEVEVLDLNTDDLKATVKPV